VIETAEVPRSAALLLHGEGGMHHAGSLIGIVESVGALGI
jgi:hypothetical protein